MSSAGVEKRGSATTVRACDLCRKRKRRCIWSSGVEGCTQCVNLKETCTTTHIRKQRAKPQKGNRIAEYESRIKRLESMLQQHNAAQPHVNNQRPLQAADRPVPVSTWVSSFRDEFQHMPRPEVPDFDPFDEDTEESSGISPSDDIGALTINDLGQNGNTTDASIPMTLDDIQPSVAFQEDAAFLQSAEFEPEALATEIIPPPVPTTASCDWYLPPPEVGTSLLAEYLNDFNAAYPLYDPHVIADHLRVCYAGQSDGSSVAWTSAYVIFGIAHMLRAMSTTGTAYDGAMSKYYLARIYNGLNGVLFSPPSLGLVQCLIGVVSLISTTPCSYYLPEGHFISTALRVIHSISYQEDGTRITKKEEEEQEQRVFWLAFILDTNASIVNNTPTTHRHEDVVPCQPDFASKTLGALTAAEGDWKVDIFALRVNLAMIQAEAIDQVLSVGSRNTTAMDLDAALAVVLTRLLAFHDHEIFKLSPSQLFQMLYRSDIVHTVSLEASYFATVFRLHAFVTFERNARINPFSLEGMSRIAKAKKQKGFAAAKRLLSLLPIAPRGDVGLYWQQHRVFLAALITVFAHHIYNPQDQPPTSTEISQYNQVLTDIGIMVQNSGNVEIGQIRALALTLFMKLETGLRIQWIQAIAEKNGTLTPDILRGESGTL